MPSLTHLLMGAAVIGASFVAAAQTTSGARATQSSATSSAAAQFYQQAIALIDQRDWAQAYDLLTRVVAIDGGHLGAWMDLAVVARQLGRPSEALEFLNTLERRAGVVPAPIALAVDRLRQAIEREGSIGVVYSDGQPWGGVISRLGVEWFSGRDTNVNGGLREDAITLSLPGGQTRFLLDGASQAQSSGFVGGRLVGQKTMETGQRSWLVTGSAALKHYASVSGFDQSDWDVLALTDTTALGGVFGYWGPQVSATTLAGRLVYSAMGLQLSAGQRTGPMGCAQGQQVDSSVRNYHQASELSNYWLGYSYTLACDPGRLNDWLPAGGLGRVAWQFQASVGIEIGQRDSRPGGDTVHLSTAIAASLPAPFGISGHEVSARLHFQGARDTSGYSPLLTYGAQREVHRTSLGLAWLAPAPEWLSQLGPTMERSRLRVEVQAYDQRSNISLFRHSGSLLQLGVLTTF